MWDVRLTKRAAKQFACLPPHIKNAVLFLTEEIRKFGPLRHNWKNFSKLKGIENRYHCHIKKGNPTYIACWEVTDKKIKLVEVYYVGTHEKAPY